MSIEYSELIGRLEEFQERLETLCAAVEVEKGLQEITELEGRMASPDFWNNNDTWGPGTRRHTQKHYSKESDKNMTKIAK